MMAKFASVTATALTLLGLTILLGSRGFAQSTPAAQTPTAAPAEQTPAAQAPATSAPASSAPASATQKPDSGQESADEVSSSRRKAKPHDFKNWNYNASIGANVDTGSTKKFVRGGGGAASAGVARNANKYLGLRADFIWANLPLRQSTLGTAQATGATSNLFAITLDPIINIPVNHLYSGYILFGPGFYHRFGHLDDETTIPGSACSPFWAWWGSCSYSNFSIPLSGNFDKSSVNEFGYNVGAGIARKVHGNSEVYAEYRLMHGNHNNVQTDVRPITVGVRW